MARSPNRHNKIFIEVEPLEPHVVELIRNGTISENIEKKLVVKMLRDEGWDPDQARNWQAIDERGNIMTELTKGVQFLQESMDSIRAGFDDIMKNGPLAYEFTRGVKVVLTNYVPHEDAAHRTYAQLMPASRRAILGALLSANPTLLEPVLGIEVKGPSDLIGAITGVIQGKRGKLVKIDQREVMTIVEGEIPASETFDLSEKMRGATAGKAVWNTHFKLWQPVPSQHADAAGHRDQEAQGPASGAAEGIRVHRQRVILEIQEGMRPSRIRSSLLFHNPPKSISFASNTSASPTMTTGILSKYFLYSSESASSLRSSSSNLRLVAIDDRSCSTFLQREHPSFVTKVTTCKETAGAGVLNQLCMSR